MLILARLIEQSVKVTCPDGTVLSVMVVGVEGNKVKLGFTAPLEYAIHREEVFDAICRGGSRNGGNDHA
jgi:carbon storage regulator CsrA